jgi:hypothetical protein
MYRVLKPGGLAAVTFPIRENFMRFRPTRTEGFYLHELADLEAAFRDAGFVETRTERNDAVRFGAHCMLGRKPDANQRRQAAGGRSGSHRSGAVQHRSEDRPAPWDPTVRLEAEAFLMTLMTGALSVGFPSS